MRNRLSKTYQTDRSIQACYTGGKICIAQKDQSRLFCWCNGDVAISNIDDGQVTLKIEAGESDNFITFAVDPKGKTLITSAQSLLLTTWDLSNEGKKIKSWKGHQLPVLSMETDPTGTLVATGSTDRSVRVWDIATGHCTHRFTGHQGTVTRLLFRPHFTSTRMEVVSLSEGGEIRVSELYSRRVRTLDDHVQSATGLAFSYDGKRMFTVGRDKVINTWDTSDYSLLRTTPVYEELEGVISLPPSVLFEGSKLGECYIATGGEKGVLKIWNTKKMTMEFSKSLDKHDKNSDNNSNVRMDGEGQNNKQEKAKTHILQMFLADAVEGGGAVVTSTQEHNIRFHSLMGFHQSRIVIGHNDEILDIAWAPLSTILKANVEGDAVFVATNSPVIRVYDVKTLNARLLVGHNDTVISLCISADNRFLLSGSKDTTIRLWRLNEAGTVTIEKANNKMMMMMIEGKEASHSSTDDSGGIEELKKSADGVVAHLKDINGLAVSADDNLVATGSSDRTVKLWKANDLTSPLATLKGHKRGVWSVVFSPVDRVVCSSSGDQTIKIWAVDGDFACLRTFQGHEASVTQVCFINAGTQLLSASSDAAVKLWTIKTNECINTFAEEAHEDKIWALRCWGDGGSIVTGGEDSRIVFWHDATEEEEEAERMEREHNILKEQELRNCLRNKEWAKAIRIALKLSHSRQLFKIFRHLYRHASTDEVLREALGDCTIEERARIVLWSREWNTHTDYVPVAHFVLSRLLREHALLDGANTTVSSEIRQPLREAAQHIIRYSERHLKRLDKLLQRTYLLDYMLASTSIL
eukprot:jgi/Bigna1/45107/e_gw1.111.9.1